jgi:hypothetical protein
MTALADQYPGRGEPSVFDDDRTERIPSPLDVATAAAMPGLEYIHDTREGQTYSSNLPVDHPEFPGHVYTVNNFYFGMADAMHGYGTWTVEVFSSDGRTRILRGSVQALQLEDGLSTRLVRPVKGATLAPVDDPDLERQVASVLHTFAGDFQQFQTAKAAKAHERRERRWGWVGRIAALGRRAA